MTKKEKVALASGFVCAGMLFASYIPALGIVFDPLMRDMLIMGASAVFGRQLAKG